MSLRPETHRAIASRVTKELALLRPLSEAEVVALEDATEVPAASKPYRLAHALIVADAASGPPDELATAELERVLAAEMVAGRTWGFSERADTGAEVMFGFNLVPLSHPAIRREPYVSFVAVLDRPAADAQARCVPGRTRRHEFYVEARDRALALRSGFLLISELRWEGSRR